MAAIDVAKRPAAVRTPVDRRVGRRRQQCGRVRGAVARRRTIAKCDEQAATILDVLDQTPAKLPAWQVGIVDQDQRPAREIRRGYRAKALRRDAEVRLVANSERSLDVQAARRAAFVSVDDEH